MRTDTAKLKDILEAIQFINSNIPKDNSLYNLSELELIGIVHMLQVIGEAARSLSTDLKEKNPEVEWFKVIGMRNIIVHEYFRVDYSVIENVIKQNLPVLQQQIEAILNVKD